MNHKIQRYIEWKTSKFSNEAKNAVDYSITAVIFLAVFVVISFFTGVYSNIIASSIFGAIYAIELILLICFARIFFIEQIRIRNPIIITCPHSCKHTGKKIADYVYLIVNKEISLNEIGLTIKIMDTKYGDIVLDFTAKNPNSWDESIELQIENMTVHGDVRYVEGYELERPKIAPKNMDVYKFEITIFNTKKELWKDNYRIISFFSVSGSTYNNL
jgi:hypothetical protein